MAPELSNSLFVKILSFKLISFTGNGSRAEPPPEISIKTRSSLSRFFNVFLINLAAFKPSLFGIGCPEEKHLNPLTSLKFSLLTTTTPFLIFIEVLENIDFAVSAMSTEAFPMQITNKFLTFL